MGLIAREIEGRGIATVSLSSALSITAAVAPPRAVFVDFPLGHTAGPRGDRAMQRQIALDALDTLVTADHPGLLRRLTHRWPGGDGWKRTAMRPAPGGQPRDDRTARSTEPQYQYPEDREAAEAAAGDAERPEV